MLPLHDDQPTKRFPFATILLILANLAVFVGWQLKVGIPESVEIAAMVPAEFTHSPSPDSFVHMMASMFMHAGWMHILGNMWFLWIFGNNVEDAMGPGRFVSFYLLCGVIADMAHIGFSPDSTLPMIGASGAVSGILGAYLFLHPKASISTLVPIFFFIRIVRLPAFLFLLVWIGLQILAQTMSNSAAHRQQEGVAYLAHIGGFFSGLALIFFFKKTPG